MPQQFSAATVARFWAKVRRTDDGCWLWRGARSSTGYGNFVLSPKPHAKLVKAHRFAYVLQVGEIPQGLAVCHRCDIPLCVRGDHLFTGTWTDNARDKESKGRHYHFRGEENPVSKLTESQVREIRFRYAAEDVSFVTLGGDYGVTGANVRHIVRRKTWRHVP
jgi:hypothetical protein